MRRSSHVKYVEPDENIVQQLPSRELLQKYERSSKLLLPEKDIPDLCFTAGKLETISEFKEHSKNSWDDVDKVVESIETTVCYQDSSDEPLATPHNSNFRKHSQNLLKDAVGVALEWLSVDETVQPDRGEQQCDIFRKSKEESQNLQVEQSRTVPNKTDDTMKEVWCEQCQGRISKSEEHSLKSWVNWSTNEVEDKLLTMPLSKDTMSGDRMSDFSEFLRKLLGNKGDNVSVPKLSWINSMTQIVGLTAARHQEKVEGDPVGTNVAGSPKVNKKPVHAEFNFFL